MGANAQLGDEVFVSAEYADQQHRHADNEAQKEKHPHPAAGKNELFQGQFDFVGVEGMVKGLRCTSVQAEQQMGRGYDGSPVQPQRRGAGFTPACSPVYLPQHSAARQTPTPA